MTHASIRHRLESAGKPPPPKVEYEITPTGACLRKLYLDSGSVAIRIIPFHQA